MQRTSRISFAEIFGQFGFRFYVMGHQSTQNIFLLKYWADIPRDQGSPKRPSTLITPIKLSPSPDLSNRPQITATQPVVTAIWLMNYEPGPLGSGAFVAISC